MMFCPPFQSLESPDNISHMIMHRQTKRTIHLERVLTEIDNINIPETVGQQEIILALAEDKYLCR